jgi:hypothetical protein
MICALLTGGFKPYDSTDCHYGILNWYNNGAKNDVIQAVLIQLWVEIDEVI